MAEKTIRCLVIDDEPLAREIIVTHLEKISGIEIISQCRNANEAFDILTTQQIDLLFLDINMPEISGMSLAKSIDRQIKIIFTTAYRDFAVESFELQAIDYLLKPISFDRMLQAVNHFKKIYFGNQSNINEEVDLSLDYLFVRADRKMIKIDFREIIYVESYSDYIKIQTTEKSIVTRETITSIEKKLPASEFIRIHRSYIVAIKRIESYTRESVEVANKEFSISRSYKHQVLNLLEKF